jgi:adenylate cyclase
MQISIENARQKEVFEFDSSRPVELGRLADVLDSGSHQITILDEFTSRRHLRIGILDVGSIEITNLSASLPVVFADGTRLGPGEKKRVQFRSVRLMIGQTTIAIEMEVSQQCFLTLSSPIAEPEPRTVLLSGSDPSTEDLTKWFETVLTIQRAAAGTQEFFEEAVRVVQLIGFDQGLVVQRVDGQWVVLSCFPASTIPSFSSSILDSVVRQKRTLYEGGHRDSAVSLQGVTLAAASPMFSNGEVTGAIYATRFRREFTDASFITRVQAQLLQIIAAAVGAGIERRSKELALARQQHRFEQFFSPVLSQELERDPDLLNGREREITVLFCDVRQFSGISADITPHETCQLINDVMDTITPPVLETHGVVMDYIGDSMIAMWNAPNNVTDHAEMACLTALRMIKALESLQGRWTKRLGREITLGIGINSGPALVGNTGCKFRFKYGALGHTLNLASRIEGATKQFGVSILISEFTARGLSSSIRTRRVANIRVVGIDTPVKVYELLNSEDGSESQQLVKAYEDALTEFEAGEFKKCNQLLQSILQRDEIDYPSLVLSSRAIECLRSQRGNFEPVFDLTSK